MKKRLLSALIVWAGLQSAVLAQDCTNLEADLKLSGSPASRLVSPQLAASLAWPHLQHLFTQAKEEVKDVSLLELSHDDTSYNILLVVSQYIFWDTLQLQVDFPAENKLRLRLIDNWIPSGLIMNRLHDRLKHALDGRPIKLTQSDKTIELELLPETAQLTHSTRLAHWSLSGKVAPDGALGINITSSPSDTATNSLLVKNKLCGEAAKGLTGDFKAVVRLDLKPEDLRPISLGSEKLIERLQATKGSLVIEGKGDMKLDPMDLQAKGSLQIVLDELEVERKFYTQVQSVPFKWRYSFPDQLEIYPELPEVKPAAPALTNNKLTLFTQGPAYYTEMIKAVSQARESVEQEIFAYHDGETTRALARLYILKALGLKDSPKGFVPDPYAPGGIRAFLMHNHYLTYKGTREVQHLFDAETDKVFAELAQNKTRKTPAQITALRERLRQNLRITPLTDGVVHSDHRKLLVIDGRMAYTGGRNLADFYLTEDAYRDVMIRVEGPAVRAMHQAFIDNWKELTPGESVNWNLRSVEQLKAGLSAAQHLSPSTMLTTSRKGWEIQSAMLKLINEARETIRIEYAYLYHEPIEAALREAKARGVDIELLFSERSDETLFDHLNPATALSLIKAPGSGKVSSWLWQSHGGKHDYMVHTKFMSADGKRAIAGSANLIPRSLQSPFSSAGVPLMFNEEIVLYIEDPVFVSSLDQELFNQDRQHSREFKAPDLEALIEKRGGNFELLIEKLKGLLA